MADITTSDITPNRKRKRDYEKEAEIRKNSCFTNAAFNASSTPKKIVGRRRLVPTIKENINPINSCMEVKSIAALVEEQRAKTAAPPTVPLNPYEVQRKPPKKKKREAAIEEACFVNPALNLNVPEKQFNPYEVVRDVNKNYEDRSKCFVNAALDIKSQDAALKVRNPFEIDRESVKSSNESSVAGYENLALSNVKPTSLKIGIPFTPTVGCRIDFNNIPLTQLTPSKLLLAEKLVFSPVPVNSSLPKRSLDAISEESSSVSIGKELDRYQLELENSINEAKMRKHDPVTETIVADKECVYQLQLKVEKRVSLTTKLSDIAEIDECEIENSEKVEVTELELKTIQEDPKNKNVAPSVEVENMQTNIKKIDHLNNENNCNGAFSFDSDDEDNIDFKTPAPFVRAYRRDNPLKCNSKESLNSNSSEKSSSENIAASKKQNNVKNLIRKSIRKILPTNHHTKVDNEPKLMPDTHETKEHEEKHCTLSSHIMTSLRQSLRRKPKPKVDTETEANAASIPLAEVSIIDTSERKIKLKSSLAQNEYARIEELTNEKKHSLRHSTREMRHQIMKTLFQHKQEEYSLQK